MDPRHPELAIPRVKELLKQYDRVLDDINHAELSSKLNELEREGILVVQELYLVVPRLRDALTNASQQRRHDLARGVLIEPQDTAVENPVENPVEKYVAPNQAETVIVEPKPRKKTTKKKEKK